MSTALPVSRQASASCEIEDGAVRAVERFGIVGQIAEKNPGFAVSVCQDPHAMAFLSEGAWAVRKNQHPGVPTGKGVGMFRVGPDLACRIVMGSGAEKNDEFMPRKSRRIDVRSLLTF